MTRKTDRTFVILSDGSFRVTRDAEEERRPKKRQRVDSDDEDDGRRPATGSSPSTPKKDTTNKPTSSPTSTKRVYYARDSDFFYADLPDANIYVGVQGTVFKIHKHVLECCEVMVDRYRFGTTPPSEESPLLLEKATVEEYKAFLWTNYASVEELNKPPHENEFVERIHLIVSLTKKYKIPKLEEFTSFAITRLTDDSVYLSSCSSSTLTHIADACVSYKLTNPLAKLTATWISRLERGAAPSAPAIIACDAFNLPPRLRGLAYYQHVQDMVDRRGTSSTGAMQLRSDDKLNNGQILRLFAGHMSLVGYWENLRLKPIVLPVPDGKDTPSSGTRDPDTPKRNGTSTAPSVPGPSTPGGPTTSRCPGGETHKRCVATWERRWISAAGWKRILGIPTSDTLALLECFRDQLANDEETKNGMEPGCRAAGLEALKAMRAKVKEDLNDHFMGVA